MAWFLVKHRDNFTFFYLYLQYIFMAWCLLKQWILFMLWYLAKNRDNLIFTLLYLLCDSPAPYTFDPLQKYATTQAIN
jgi:hypothetical protein